MLSKNEDLERIKQIVREEFETLRARGRLDDDLFIESIIEKPIPNFYEEMYSVLYKDN